MRSFRAAFGLGLGLLLAAASSFANTYTVTSTADRGAGTLRQAVLDANANAGPDNIALQHRGKRRAHDHPGEPSRGPHLAGDDRRLHAERGLAQHAALRPGTQHGPAHPGDGRRGRGNVFHRPGERYDHQGSRHERLHDERGHPVRLEQPRRGKLPRNRPDRHAAARRQRWRGRGRERAVGARRRLHSGRAQPHHGLRRGRPCDRSKQRRRDRGQRHRHRGFGRRPPDAALRRRRPSRSSSTGRTGRSSAMSSPAAPTGSSCRAAPAKWRAAITSART